MSREKKRPKVAVVLGAGVLTSLGAVSLFKHLDEWEVPVDMAIGCSGGAMAAACWATGLDLHSILLGVPELIDRSQTFAEFNYRTLAGMVGFPIPYDRTKGVWKARGLREMYHAVFRDLRIEELQKVLRLETTDVESIAPYTLQKGAIFDAVYASTALFPFLPPLQIEDKWLCDGGWANPIPLRYPLQQDYDVIIGLNVGVEMQTEPEDFNKHIFYFFSQANATSEVAERQLQEMQTRSRTEMILYNFDHPVDFDRHDRVDAVLEEIDGHIRTYSGKIKDLYQRGGSRVEAG